MVVATELLLGGDNTSIDLDFCFMLALAEEFGSLLLKKLVTIIHNGQNNKVKFLETQYYTTDVTISGHYGICHSCRFDFSKSSN